jgi:hypothetical protein
MIYVKHGVKQVTMQVAVEKYQLQEDPDVKAVLESHKKE